ncbi:hypothetical protein PTKIN_Ptkin15bG0067000 [Pterospermum kingtungense]
MSLNSKAEKQVGSIQNNKTKGEEEKISAGKKWRKLTRNVKEESTESIAIGGKRKNEEDGQGEMEKDRMPKSSKDGEEGHSLSAAEPTVEAGNQPHQQP